MKRHDEPDYLSRTPSDAPLLALVSIGLPLLLILAGMLLGAL